MKLARDGRSFATGIWIFGGALLIAASILVVGRYSVGRVEVRIDDAYVVYAVDTWTGNAVKLEKSR